MKIILLLSILFSGIQSFSQGWNFVGSESFTPLGCSSMKIERFGNAGLVVVTDPWDGASRYVHPYFFDGSNWDTLYDVINHGVFSTFDLWPDIEMNSTNQYFIYTFAGPNKSYLYQSNIGNGNWDLVDSVNVDHVDLEPLNTGGDVYMSGYGGVFQHHYGTGSNTAYAFPTLMSGNPLAVNNANDAISFHATNSNGYEVNSLSGGIYTQLDSFNYGSNTSGYDIVISQNQPVTVHLDKNTNQISLAKYNGSTWDQIYVNSSATYINGEVSFNMGVEGSSGDIVLGVHHFITTTGPTMTTNTIDVYKISADLTSETDLGTATSFTYTGGGTTGIFDVEVQNNKVYVGYVNYADSSKASVKTYDLNTISLNEIEEINFNMYPNPTHGSLNIYTEQENYLIEIYDLSGKLVHQSQESQSTNIDLNQLDKGVYLVHFKNAESTLRTEKLLIQ